MRHPVRFTCLGFLLNSLVDKGEYLDLEETHLHMRNMTLFHWLKKKYESGFDISLYEEKELAVIESFFNNLSNSVDAQRKMGINKNGLCLLISYCFEGLQNDISEIK